MSIALFKKKVTPIYSSGFTVIELMVTITIVVLVTGVIMVQYSSFNSSVLLTSQAYLTAFDVREAQSLAVSVRGQSSEFYEQYGLYFDMATPNMYLLFQDNDSNNGSGDDVSPARYDEGEEIGIPFLVDSRFEIIDMCGFDGAVRSCFADGFDDVAITFKRPDFDAAFYSQGFSNLQSVEILIGTSDGNGLTKTVTVYTTGQIDIN